MKRSDRRETTYAGKKRVRVDKKASSLVFFSSWHSSEGDLDRNMETLGLSNGSDIMHSCVKR